MFGLMVAKHRSVFPHIVGPEIKKITNKKCCKETQNALFNQILRFFQQIKIYKNYWME